MRFSVVPLQALAGTTAGDAVAWDGPGGSPVGTGLADGSMAGVASSLTDAEGVSGAPAAEPAAEPTAPDLMGATVPYVDPQAATTSAMAATAAMAATGGRRWPGLQKDR